jgi:hypothetical protein
VQGLVMLFQNNYQRKRLYVRKTLGKARAIDVDSSETLVEKVRSQSSELIDDGNKFHKHATS